MHANTNECRRERVCDESMQTRMRVNINRSVWGWASVGMGMYPECVPKLLWEQIGARENGCTEMVACANGCSCAWLWVCMCVLVKRGLGPLVYTRLHVPTTRRMKKRCWSRLYAHATECMCRYVLMQLCAFTTMCVQDIVCTGLWAWVVWARLTVSMADCGNTRLCGHANVGECEFTRVCGGKFVLLRMNTSANVHGGDWCTQSRVRVLILNISTWNLL